MPQKEYLTRTTRNIERTTQPGVSIQQNTNGKEADVLKYLCCILKEYTEYILTMHDALFVSAELHQSHEAVCGGASVESLQPARRRL